MRGPRFLDTLAVTALLIGGAALEAAAQADTSQATGSDGVALFTRWCAECHDESGSERVPGLFSLRSLSPRAIVSALETGIMRAEGDQRHPVAKRTVELTDRLDCLLLVGCEVRLAVGADGLRCEAVIDQDVERRCLS